tara:strand:- start:4040 stop:4429 length:390 start_codon:yes stop_codon:yes gene_type:complete
MENDNSKIIQFPNNMKVKDNVKITDTAIKLHTDLKFAEHLTEGLIVNMIHNMSENDIDVDNPEFIKHIGFLVEVVKSTIYQDMGVKHPMQQMVDLFVNSDYDEEQGLYTEFDMGTMKDVIVELIGEEKD